MTRDEKLTALLLALGLVGVAWWSYQDGARRRVNRGGPQRQRGVAAESVRGAALDGGLSHCTPAELAHHFGPGEPHWTPHRITYPLTPGYEFERLMYGAPGGWNVTIPEAQRTWVFNPPSEVDL